MLEDTYSSYRALADTIHWKKYNCNELFFEYIKHEGQPEAEKFYAGIVCRYWGYAGRVYSKCNQHISFEKCYDILIDTINYVLEKRVWENESSSLYGDKAAPDKAFHMVLKRMLSVAMSNLTAYKRKSNYNPISLDEIHEDYNDAAEGLFMVFDEVAESEIDNANIIALLKHCETKTLLMLDLMCFGNTRNPASAVKELNQDNYQYYKDKYGLEKEVYFKALVEILDMRPIELQSVLDKSLYILRGEL